MSLCRFFSSLELLATISATWFSFGETTFTVVVVVDVVVVDVVVVVLLLLLLVVV